MRILKLAVIFVLRVLFLPFAGLLLGVTAGAEFISDQDWKYWKDFNRPILGMLPWSDYP